MQEYSIVDVNVVHPQQLSSVRLGPVKFVAVVVCCLGIFVALGFASGQTIRTGRDLYSSDIWIETNCTLNLFGAWPVCNTGYACGHGLPSTKYAYGTYYPYCIGMPRVSLFMVNRVTLEMITERPYAEYKRNLEFEFVQYLILDYILVCLFWGLLFGKSQ